MRISFPISSQQLECLTPGQTKWYARELPMKTAAQQLNPKR